jgi:hypothetical protein
MARTPLKNVFAASAKTENEKLKQHEFQVFAYILAEMKKLFKKIAPQAALVDSGGNQETKP